MHDTIQSGLIKNDKLNPNLYHNAVWEMYNELLYISRIPCSEALSKKKNQPIPTTKKKRRGWLDHFTSSPTQKGLYFAQIFGQLLMM